MGVIGLVSAAPRRASLGVGGCSPRRRGRRPRDAVAVPTRSCPTSATPRRCSPHWPPTRPAPDPAALSSRLAPLLTAPRLGTRRLGQVVDVATGDVLLDQDADDPAIPASTAKLLTAVAALTTLDPADTLTTTVVAGATPGEVVLVGGGDPTLSRTAPSQTYPGAPTVADLAAQVVAALPAGTAGHPRRRRQLAVQRPAHRGRLAAQRRPLQLRRAGHRDRGRRRPGEPRLDRPQRPARSGRRAPRSPTRSAHPARRSSSARRRRAARRWRTVHSAPIARLVEQALSMSDNMLAEALARQVGASPASLPASFEGGGAGGHRTRSPTPASTSPA